MKVIVGSALVEDSVNELGVFQELGAISQLRTARLIKLGAGRRTSF